MMMENLVDIDWHDVRQAIPAFLTIVTMPLAYSIAYGVIAGVGSYLFIYLALMLVDLVTMAFQKPEQRNWDQFRDDYCPDVLAHKFKTAVPFKSPSGIIQQQMGMDDSTHEYSTHEYRNGDADAKDVSSLPHTQEKQDDKPRDQV